MDVTYRSSAGRCVCASPSRFDFRKFICFPKKPSRKLLWWRGTSPFFRFLEKYISACVERISERVSIEDTPRNPKVIHHTKSPLKVMFLACNRAVFFTSPYISACMREVSMVLLVPFTSQRDRNPCKRIIGTGSTQTEKSSGVADISDPQYLGVCETNWPKSFACDTVPLEVPNPSYNMSPPCFVLG
jgi:hypothetical protein